MLILYLVIIILLVLWRIRFSSENDYMSKDRCNSIKGIFILFIFLTHSLQYIKASDYAFPGIDALTPVIASFIGQLVVVMFLFYSGYGVATQILSKGEKYVEQMPKHRILNTLLNFDIAVCFFIVLALFLSQPLSIKQVFLSFLAWDSVGNSNWYIFVIIVCYILTYLAHRISSQYIGVVLFLFCVIVMLLLSFYKERWWHDTILTYPVGFLYGQFKNHVELVLKKYYFSILLMLSVIFFFTHGFSHSLKGLVPNVMAISFALIVVMITMRIRIDNSWLQWFGIHLFPIYIYQRLPMITIHHFWGDSFVSYCPFLYLVSCLLVTCLIAHYYKYWRISLNGTVLKMGH